METGKISVICTGPLLPSRPPDPLTTFRSITLDIKHAKMGTTLGEYLPKGIRVVPILPIGRVPKLKS